MSARDVLTDCMVVACGPNGQYTVEFERAGARVRAECTGSAVEVGQTIQVNQSLGQLHCQEVNDLSMLA